MKRKFILFLIIFFCLFALADFGLAKTCSGDQECGTGLKCIKTNVNKTCVRALEITYPKIAGEELTEEVVVKEGLPGYIKYIFTLAVGLIGLVILGVLIYNGIRYLTSVGRPEQMTEAKKGILYAFLGGLLLLSSFLIFNTINPQLTIMKLPKVEPLGQVVVPGVYICSYATTTIQDALEGYTTKTGQEQIEAAKKLRGIIWNPNMKQGCPRVNFSGNFQNFKVTKTGNTIFIVPSISIDPNTGERTLVYEYGIILHEKDNFGGQCDYFPKEKDNKIYGEGKAGESVQGQIENFSAKDLKFTAYSVTLFQKPSVEPVGDGVTLYRYFNYNREATTTATTTNQKNFKPGEDTIRVSSGELGELKENTRSISFSPVGSYFALLYEGTNFDQRCKLLHKNNLNLMDTPIGLCGTGCTNWFSRMVYGLAWWTPSKAERCAPCLNSMIVIKGSVL